MRFLGSSKAAVGTLGFFSSCSGSEVMAKPSLIKDSLGQSPGGNDRKILPNLPSNSDDRGVELSPRTPPPCPADRFLRALITALIISTSQFFALPNLGPCSACRESLDHVPDTYQRCFDP